MNKKGLRVIVCVFLLLGVIYPSFSSKNTVVYAASLVYIRADGSVEGSPYIVSSDNVTYIFTADINNALCMERGNIIIDGNKHVLDGLGIGFGIGISLQSVNNVTIKNVNIYNFINGIHLSNSTSNTIFGNNIINNAHGVNIQSSSNNKFFHNNFINNNQQVLSGTSGNVWDNGYPSGGNYWSDYTGTDLYKGPNQDLLGSDFIGDTQYKIFRKDADNYPFMIPYETQPPAVTILSPENKT